MVISDAYNATPTQIDKQGNDVLPVAIARPVRAVERIDHRMMMVETHKSGQGNNQQPLDILRYVADAVARPQE